MKITGADFRDWFDNGFPDGYYIEWEDAAGVLCDQDGDLIVEDEVIYDIANFGICVVGYDSNEWVDPIPFIEKYLKSRGFKILSIAVPVDRLEEVKEMLKRKKLELK